MEEWQARPQRIAAAYIKKTLGMDYTNWQLNIFIFIIDCVHMKTFHDIVAKQL